MCSSWRTGLSRLNQNESILWLHFSHFCEGRVPAESTPTFAFVHACFPGFAGYKRFTTCFTPLRKMLYDSEIRRKTSSSSKLRNVQLPEMRMRRGARPGHEVRVLHAPSSSVFNLHLQRSLLKFPQ